MARVDNQGVEIILSLERLVQMRFYMTLELGSCLAMTNNNEVN